MKFKLLIMFITLLFSCNGEKKKLNNINTVTGTIKASELGFTLTHEHIMSNYGMEINETHQYNTNKLLNQVIPYLKNLKSLGVETIVDCTTEYFGRRIDLLKTISDSTSIQIITNTGIYGAANDKYIPNFAYENTAEFISNIWINEFKNGIHNTNFKPGFIKLAFDKGPPSDIDTKLFKAGVLAHLSTGLPLAVHTGDNLEAVKLQTKILNQNNVNLNAWIWTHANKINENKTLLKLAKKGAWISLDAVKKSNIDEYVDRVLLFKEHNLLNKLLISHDGNGFPSGGPIRKFDAVLLYLIPKLLKTGFTQKEINQIFIYNPKEAFRIKNIE